MNWQILLYNMFGGISPEFYLSFYIFALLGMFFMMLIEKQKNKKKIKKTNLKYKLIRFIVNIIAVFLYVRFNGELAISTELTMFVAFIVGITIDGIVLIISNLKFGS